MDENRNNVWLSYKNTEGDFGWNKGFNKDIIGKGLADRQYVEFDAWREYGGNNVFPFYYGDVWKKRIKKCVNRGIENIGVRLMWNSGYWRTVQRRWSNWVNVYVLTGLVNNPDADPDKLLMDYVERYYPEGSHDIAFEIYKYSQIFMSTLLYPTNQGETVDHGRIPWEEEIGQAGNLGNEYFEKYDRVLIKMLEKIEKLPENVPFKEDLRRAAWQAASLAKGTNMVNYGSASMRFKYGWMFSDTKSWVQLRGHLIPDKWHYPGKVECEEINY